jgi:REP element-mobilizing transposase RayT
MGRAWRIEFEGAFYHILARGNEKRDIVADDADRRRLMDTIGEAAERFDLDIFAYVLMPNHYHLLLRTQQANLSRAMQWFGTTYTQRYNRRHARSGHLFQGRFKSILVENDAYLLRLSLYIHRNPVRAGLTERLADFPWSSYRAYAYGRAATDWLETDLILSQIQGADPHKTYREKAKAYAEEEGRLWEDLRCGVVLGSRDFMDKIRREYLPKGIEVEKPQQRAMAGSIGAGAYVRRASELFGWGEEGFEPGRRLRGRIKEERDLIVYWLWNTGWFKNEEIGRPLGLSISAVSHAVKAVRGIIRENERLQKKLEELNSQFKV